MPDDAIQASSSEYYNEMAADLAAFSDAVRQKIDHSAAAGNDVQTTYGGHSYGGATTSAAEKYGLDADNVVAHILGGLE